jgi:hypothetical protein
MGYDTIRLLGEFPILAWIVVDILGDDTSDAAARSLSGLLAVFVVWVDPLSTSTDYFRISGRRAGSPEGEGSWRPIIFREAPPIF